MRNGISDRKKDHKKKQRAGVLGCVSTRKKKKRKRVSLEGGPRGLRSANQRGDERNVGKKGKRGWGRRSWPLNHPRVSWKGKHPPRERGGGGKVKNFYSKEPLLGNDVTEIRLP